MKSNSSSRAERFALCTTVCFGAGVERGNDLFKFRVAHLRSLSEMAKMRTQHASLIHAMQSRMVALERRVPPPPPFVRGRSAAAQ